MSEGKDPGIKLFGRTIQLPEIPPPPPPDSAVSSCTDAPPPQPPKSEDRSSYSSSSSSEDDESDSKHVVAGNEQQSDKNIQEEKCIHEEENRAQSLMSEELTDPSATSLLNDHSKTPSVDSEAATAKTTKTEEEQSETSNSQDKTLKKPDKILPCPRCNSMDTKFCYYNNYNVNQPRHFCKNCQRYWTAGGTMRNVPVGAGRRKNKASASHYRQITVSEALQNTRADLPNGLHHPILKANGTVLTFGSDSTPLCESMTTVLKIAEKTTRQNGFNKPEEVSGNGDDHSSGSSVTDGQTCQNGFPPQVPCFPGPPWPFPWAPQMGPAFVPPGYPMPFYPAPPYWGCAVPGPWNVPWVTPPTNYHAAPSSPTLGKHSRDDENMAKSGELGEDQTQKKNEPEKSLWVPKTLRIDDPGEAAKSSIWATLGIKDDRSDAVNGSGIFKAFRSGREGKTHISEASPVLQANPAALSRSANFQESS